MATLNIGSFSMEIIGAQVFAILISMIIALCIPKYSASKMTKVGIQFTSKKILQWAVIILGFSLNLGTITKVGAKSLPIIISTILVSPLMAMLLMKLIATCCIQL